MKTQIHTYNTLLLRYKKYRNKLTRLYTSGKNEHRQSVLKKHIERLFFKLKSLQLSISRKKVMAIGMVTAMALPMINVNAQTAFQENHINLFSLQPLPMGSSGVYASLTSEDIDNDGDLDLLSGHSDGTLYYYENTGTNLNPSYGAPQTNPFSLTSLAGYSRPTFVDLDNDGDFDIMAGEYDYYSFTTRFVYFENIGTASSPNFGAPQTNPMSLITPAGVPNPSFADLDGDGDLDMMYGAVFHENIGSVSVPDFAASVTNPFSIAGSANNSELVDLDNDGDFDLLSGNGNLFTYFENIGTNLSPNFGVPQNIPFSLKAMIGGITGMSIEDLDGDGDFDILYPQITTGDLYYFENIGTATSPSFTDGHSNLFSLENSNGETPTFGDLDGDGDFDMITEQGGDFIYNENIGTAQNPNFGVDQVNPFSLISYNGSNPVLADIDDDGDLDMFTGYYPGFNFMENVGTSTFPVFGAAQSNPFSLGGTVYYTSPVFGDLDNDGDLDLLSHASSAGDFYYFENIGTASNPSFGSVQINSFGLNSNTTIVSPTLGDLDNDGDLDLLCGDPTNGGFYYFENTGSSAIPSFGTALNNPFSLRKIGTGRCSPEFIDLNGDGNLDVMSGLYSIRDFVFFENISACSVNTSVSLAGVTLTVGQSGATYQWVDCNNANAPIVGETNQSFTPAVNGNYACQVNLTACNNITNCMAITSVGIDEMLVGNVKIYPNPATTEITIEMDEQIESVTVFSISGSIVMQETTNKFSVENLSKGVYMMSVKTSEGLIHTRFVKE